MLLTGENRRTRRKTCPSSTLCTKNPTWTEPGANPGLRSERPVTKCLRHATAARYLIRAPMHNTGDVKYCDILGFPW
jgi:hypothetical protein